MLPVDMSDQITEIVIPVLRTLQADLSTLKTDVSTLKNAVQRIDARVASMDSHVAGFHRTINWQSDVSDDLRGRVEALEENTTDDPPTP